jgi:uncharacterized protein (DUF58 family)
MLALGSVMVLRGGPSALLLLGLTLFLWYAWEWVTFSVQAKIGVRNLRIRRELRDERGTVSTFWADQTFRIGLKAQLNGSIPLTSVRLSDRTPEPRKPSSGSAEWSGSMTARDAAEWSYRWQCSDPGLARFDGVRVQLADAQGFFYFETMLREPAIVPVLPALVNAEAKQRTNKRFNLLPPPGMHRMRRPGSGSELLELRDYRPGDPPKRIAWKVSARRDKLITREFESEVPLRCTLLVDAADSVRLGPPGRNVLASFVASAAAVTQAATGNRDLVGLAICDERHCEYVAPARTPRHVVTILRKLASIAGASPATQAADVEPLLNRALPLAYDVYPDLMRPGVNRFPGWIAWLRPQPGWTMRGPTWSDLIFRSTSATMAFLSFMVVSLLAGFALMGLAIVQELPVLALAGFVMLIGTLALAAGLTAKRRRTYAARKRLAALIGVVYELPLGATGLLLEDDAACAGWLQRFLADHQMHYDVPRFDQHGRPVFARPAKLDVMARALTRCVARGRDNELFVIFADLLDLHDRLSPLLKSVRVARSRHHQVLVVCPWPEESIRRLPTGPAPPPADAKADALVKYTRELRSARAWKSIRSAFGRLGVPVLRAAKSDTARLILQRLEQLRSAHGALRVR